jgi:hypothetical protein
MVIVEKLVELRLAGETEVLGENLPQHHFVHNLTYVGPRYHWITENDGLLGKVRRNVLICTTQHRSFRIDCHLTEFIIIYLFYINVYLEYLSINSIFRA